MNGTVKDLGTFDANDERLADALNQAERNLEQADRERAERRNRPGFFVVPDDRLPDL